MSAGIAEPYRRVLPPKKAASKTFALNRDLTLVNHSLKMRLLKFPWDLRFDLSEGLLADGRHPKEIEASRLLQWLAGAVWLIGPQSPPLGALSGSSEFSRTSFSKSAPLSSCLRMASIFALASATVQVLTPGADVTTTSLGMAGMNAI